MNNELNISFEEIVELQLSFEAYFILWSLYHNKKEYIHKYVEICRKIPTEDIRKLESEGYITIDNSSIVNNIITLNHLHLTAKGKQLFTLPDIDALFDEFRKYYPSRIGGRSLHSDLKRCKALYKKIIGNSIDKHKLLCKCAALYIEEKKRSNSEKYIQLLPSWLHQENYKMYMDDAKKVSEVELVEKESGLDDI